MDFTLYDPTRKIVDHKARSSYETVEFNSTTDGGDYKVSRYTMNISILLMSSLVN